MDTYVNNKTAMRSLLIVVTFLLAVHTCLLVFFACTHITLMAYVNIGSVLFYILVYILFKHKKITFCIIATFIEIMIHMFLAVLCTGWEFGFQLYFIGCLAIMFYADYFSVRLGNHHLKGVGFSAVSCLLYLISLLVIRFKGPIYQKSSDLAFAAMIINSLVVFAFVTVFFSMLTHLATYYETALAMQATHDKLTGMVNRHFLVDQLESIYAKQNTSDYWLAILDIDDFKGINDRYGHLCGDFVLKSMAEIIKKVCGDRTVCRWGGEEFVIVGSDSNSGKSVKSPESVILEEIRRSVADNRFVYDDHTVVKLTVTIGTARCGESQTVDEWINLADSRLYRGKHSGKNQVVESDEQGGVS